MARLPWHSLSLSVFIPVPLLAHEFQSVPDPARWAPSPTARGDHSICVGRTQRSSVCSVFVFFAWGCGGTLGLAGFVPSAVRCVCAVGAQQLWGQCQGDLGGEQEQGYKAHPLQGAGGHWALPSRWKGQPSLCFVLWVESRHPPRCPEQCHPPAALRAPCIPEQSQQLGLEQSLHLTLNSSLFLLMCKLFWSKEGDMKNILGSSHTVLKFNFF